MRSPIPRQVETAGTDQQEVCIEDVGTDARALGQSDALGTPFRVGVDERRIPCVRLRHMDA
jgi:hypothetical protein